MALRCTARLLKAMKLRPWLDPEPPRNRLGDWTANLIRVSRIQLVIAVSEPTRFGVVVDAAPYALIPERIGTQIMKSLLALGIAPPDVQAEIEAMQPLPIAATNSKSVLATVNRYGFDIEALRYHGLAASAAALNERMFEQIVCEPKHIGMPADRVREAFGLPPVDLAARREKLLRRIGLAAAPVPAANTETPH